MEKEYQKLELPFTQSDLEELLNGYDFNCAFETDKGETIQIRLYNEDLEEGDDEE